MKKILGLDLGTTSIGWAFVKEADSENEHSSIERIGVRVNPLTTDEQTDFEKGKTVSSNADRTLKRGARRNLNRYKQRRQNLINILLKAGVITKETVLAESEKSTTHSTYLLRSNAASEQIALNDFARVLLMINKKRGYKSSRKAKNEDEGQIIDGMAVAKTLYDDNITPGQYCYSLLKQGKKYLPDFYKSDLKSEFEKVWNFQMQFHPAILSDELKNELNGKGQKATVAIFISKAKVYTAENKTGTRDEKKLRLYEWRSKAISEQLKIEEVASVVAEINSNINSSSGYLGAISDRSKELYFNKETIGQHLYKQLKNDPHTRTKGQVFYRQDYLDEFETVWETQARFHAKLTPELKTEIRDIIIFFQRKLKSQKGLVSYCEFESKTIEVVDDGKYKTKTIGYKVAPKSSPLFQEFKIWQNLHNIKAQNKVTKEVFLLNDKAKQDLFFELNIKGNLDKKYIVEFIGYKNNEWELNFSSIEGNRTNKALYEVFEKIIKTEGSDEIDFAKMSANEIKNTVRGFLKTSNIDTSILEFDATLQGKAFEQQTLYQIWHLLYSYVEDKSATGNDELYRLLHKKFGIKREYAQMFASISLPQDYGNLSAKAMRKIFPFITNFEYSEACEKAGYNHSSSKTKKENSERILKDTLTILPKNSLRNPVVEKILNQMVNVVNAIIAEPNLGKPDEIRIELARELKKNAKERAEMTTNINASKLLHEGIIRKLQTEFGIKNPSRNDLIRYKLYEELKGNGYHTLYSNTYIPQEKLFSKEFDIEHIIPKSRLFDDSFSNKTLETRFHNDKKGDDTAFEFVNRFFGSLCLEQYKDRVDMMYKLNLKNKEDGISKTKQKKLLMKADEISKGFIERDLRDSQYIAKKAKTMLEEICKTVVSTTGSITNRLRDDWDLINVMQELNFDKYKKLGLIETIEKKDGNTKERIVDWTKRNDHRHHAMDALTVAFTKHNHIQYLNYLNARKDENNKMHSNVIAIEDKETILVTDDYGNKKRKFKLPINNFRSEAKKQLENVLVSIKAKNKVVTKNKNKINSINGEQVKIELTPRGQLHKESVYGKLQQYAVKFEKVGIRFNEATILKVAKPKERAALLQRLKENNNDPKKAFTGKNSLDKNPIYLDAQNNIKLDEKVKLVSFEDDYTIRKEITPDLKVDKVIDVGVRRKLQERLNMFNGNAKEAFSNIKANPIWLNKEKGIAIERVTISGIKNAEALHTKKDHLGNEILDTNGNPIANDFISTGNNHHVAIYKDADGNLQEKVVSFYEAVARVNDDFPVIIKNPKTVWDKVINKEKINQELIKNLPPDNWEFLFTMKQNEYFIFPSDDFNPKEIDLLNPINNTLISKNLFRVQTISVVIYGNNVVRDFKFRHHLETKVEDKKELQNITFKQIKSLAPLKTIVKVRINHIGQIVKIGEY